MTKAVRLQEYLYVEIEKLALAEKRSLANMVSVLLEQALALRNESDSVRAAAGFITPQGQAEAKKTMTGKTDLIEHFPQTAPRSVDSHFKPDPK